MYYNIINLLLAPFVALYSIILKIRIKAYDLNILRSHHSDRPIISIGNIALGGQGKTPLCSYIAQYFIENEQKVHISMRGYKGLMEKKGALLVKEIDNVECDPLIYGDEACFHFHNIKKGSITVGKNRWAQLLKYHKQCDPDIILLDDGLQHLKIKKDLNIALLHTNMLIKAYQLFPIGKLRDLLSSLNKVDLLCINHGIWYDEDKERHLIEFLRNNNIEKPFTSIIMNFSLSHPIPKQKKIVAFSALANNSYFIDSLKYVDIFPEKSLGFPDHYNYPKGKIQKLFQSYPEENYHFITSEKDYYKVCGAFNKNNLSFLKMNIGFPSHEKQQILHDAVESVKLKTL